MKPVDMCVASHMQIWPIQLAKIKSKLQYLLLFGCTARCPVGYVMGESGKLGMTRMSARS